MSQQTSHTEYVCKSLNQKCFCDNKLFSDMNTPCFWRLSDLALLYPDFFNPKQLIPQSTISALNDSILHKIPEFKHLTQQPIHILTIKEKYTIYDNKLNELKQVTGLNQHLTNLACEYLFKQFPNTSTEQAYFLSPTKNANTVSKIADEIEFEHIRNQISFTCNTLSSFINKTIGSTPKSFRQIWMIIWANFYRTNDVNAFRKQHNIKSSLINYMSPLSLKITDKMLQDIIVKYINAPSHNINTLAQIAKNSALSVQNSFAKHKTTPAMQLLSTNTHNRIEKLNRARENFWRANYPQSLQK